MRANPPQPQMLTIEEVSKYLRVHPSTVYKLVRSGVMPGFKVGADWRFNRELIDQWRRNLESKGAAHLLSK